ncbi:FAD-dependent monooxygenase [Streptomyces rubiginosohelvolus]|uniref:FAD-dependent monooxygenase n=1 Tax=Streptomyces rubiginosohelvolus TaxID=67362 RepID=UPI0036C3B408
MTTGNGTQPGAATAPAAPVIVVGAGPVGLLLAGELRLGGAGVVVVDDRPGPTSESRASTLHARTMEILDSRGLLAELGLPANEPRGHYGGLPLDLTLPSSHPGQWKVSQTRTEELLQRWARALGADVRRGLRVRALAQDASGVSVEAEAADGSVVRLRGCLLVGCDGELSTVRRLVGAELAGREAGREMLRADVRGVRIENRRFQRLPGGLAVAATREGVTRVMVHEFGSTVRPRSGPPGFEEVAAAWKRVTGDDISGGTPLWLNSFGDANRQLTRYRHGRVLFAGDAAHQQMPVGGQALNLGLQDAFNLGWKLALEAGGRAPEGLLDSYHRERHATGRRVLANIRAQSDLLLGGPEAEPLRALCAELLALAPVREDLAAAIAGLDIRYADGAGEPSLLGRRLPPSVLDTGAGEVWTPALLRSGRGLFLDLGPSPVTANAGAAAVVAGWTDRVVLARGRPRPGGALSSATALLVRPDGHVAWVGGRTPADRWAGAHDALRRWFGPAARRKADATRGQEISAEIGTRIDMGIDSPLT